MNSRKILGVVLLLLLGVTASGTVKILPTDPDIRYTGRWNFDDPSVPWVYWQGSCIIVNFEGTGIAIDIDAGSSEGQ